MKYMGSKNRIFNQFKHYIQNDIDDGYSYWEPFVGGGNAIDKLTGFRVGTDADEHTISALILIRDSIHLLPKDNIEFTEQNYKKIKQDKNNVLYGYVAYALSYGGKFWGGWRRDGQGDRDYVAEAYRNAVIQSDKIQECIFKCIPYSKAKVSNIAVDVIYCDPPYQNTTGYKSTFDHNRFWEWVRQAVSYGNKVYVSEYTAPDDFVCIWEKEQVSSLTKDTGSKKAIERLFVHKSQAGFIYIPSREERGDERTP